MTDPMDLPPHRKYRRHPATDRLAEAIAAHQYGLRTGDRHTREHRLEQARLILPEVIATAADLLAGVTPQELEIAVESLAAEFGEAVGPRLSDYVDNVLDTYLDELPDPDGRLKDLFMDAMNTPASVEALRLHLSGLSSAFRRLQSREAYTEFLRKENGEAGSKQVALDAADAEVELYVTQLRRLVPERVNWRRFMGHYVLVRDGLTADELYDYLVRIITLLNPNLSELMRNRIAQACIPNPN
jgi:hypothetical protein